jgi:hypothetical protein
MKRSISVSALPSLLHLSQLREKQEEEHLSKVLYLPCCTSHGQETERQEMRHEREAPPSSLLLQRKERIAWVPD